MRKEIERTWIVSHLHDIRVVSCGYQYIEIPQCITICVEKSVTVQLVEFSTKVTTCISEYTIHIREITHAVNMRVLWIDLYKGFHSTTFQFVMSVKKIQW